MVCVCAVIF